MEVKLRRLGNKTGAQLDGRDWKKLSRDHEAMFAGKLTKKGEMLANGSTAKADQEMMPRVPASIKAQFSKMDELVATFQQVLDDFTDAEAEESSSDDGGA